MTMSLVNIFIILSLHFFACFFDEGTKRNYKKIDLKWSKDEQIENLLHEEWGNHALHTSTIYKWIERAKTSSNNFEDQIREGRPIDKQL